ncbi:MAG: 5-oxoprolinase subunit PxpB [Chitinophagaceae bacterium]|nr:5-oxoprolinase subunit PxpB [Chitinophagaceae bacterium]
MNLQGLIISQLGDTAIIINFENKIDETLNSKVLHLLKKLKENALPFIKDIVPGYSSLVIFYDLLIMKSKNPINKTCIEIITDQLKKIMEEDIEISSSSRRIKIPVCYAEKYAWDINEISKEKNIPVDEIIRLHTAKKYRIYMIGFLPGFAYMGEVDEKIAIPRKTQPRNKVEAGSVGIAGLQTGIYPLDSPGGWQIIGKTPVKLFTKENGDPVLLQPGDEIEFYSITEDEFANY